MKWMVAVLYTLVSSVLFAAPLTEDQKDVTSFIRKFTLSVLKVLNMQSSTASTYLRKDVSFIGSFSLLI